MDYYKIRTVNSNKTNYEIIKTNNKSFIKKYEKNDETEQNYNEALDTMIDYFNTIKNNIDTRSKGKRKIYYRRKFNKN